MRDTQAFKHDYYNTLGLEAVATETEIKLAFRQLALKFHPDKNPDPEAEQKFHDITEAYEVLRDPEKRRSYDDTMAQNRFKSESESRQKYAIVDQLLRKYVTVNFLVFDPFSFIYIKLFDLWRQITPNVCLLN